MGGFSECGDATLWLVVPRKSSRRQARWRKWITWATEEEETEENTSDSRIQGYALQLYDDSHQQQARATAQIRSETNKEQPTNNNINDLASSLASSSFTSTYSNYHTTPSASASSSSSSSASASSEDMTLKECLTRRRKDKQLVLVPCSQDRAWAWHFNEHGILHFKKPKSSSSLGRGNHESGDSKREKQKHTELETKKGKKPLECLGRNASQAAILMPCSGRQAPTIPQSPPDSERVLQIGLVRQATAESMLAADARRSTQGTAPNTEPDNFSSAPRETEPRFPPSPFDIAHSHASITASRVELKSTAAHRTSFSSKSSSSSPSTTTSGPISPPLSYFKDTNPILLATGHGGLSGGDNLANSKTEKSPLLVKTDKKPSNTIGSSSTSSPVGASATRAKPIIRKIQTNPYINESTEERWTDPKTGLVYHTDLCRYLGHDRKEVGRHTITGVGQYMKTVFNIKVCTFLGHERGTTPKVTVVHSRFHWIFSLFFTGLRCRIICLQTRSAGRSRHGTVRQYANGGTARTFQLLRNLATHDAFHQLVSGNF